MHGVGDLARFLGSDPKDEELESSASEIAFADYAQYFRDKQSIVSYEDTQQRSYRQQINKSLRHTVRLVKGTNMFLIACGAVTLVATVVLAVFAAIHPGRIPIALPISLLGVSVAQLVTIFFSRPVQELTAMLNREAVFRLLLESRSLRLALARYHLTTPQALDGGEGAKWRPRSSGSQLNVLADLDKVDFDRFASFADCPERQGPGWPRGIAAG